MAPTAQQAVMLQVVALYIAAIKTQADAKAGNSKQRTEASNKAAALVSSAESLFVQSDMKSQLKSCKEQAAVLSAMSQEEIEAMATPEAATASRKRKRTGVHGEDNASKRKARQASVADDVDEDEEMEVEDAGNEAEDEGGKGDAKDDAGNDDEDEEEEEEEEDNELFVGKQTKTKSVPMKTKGKVDLAVRVGNMEGRFDRVESNLAAVVNLLTVQKGQTAKTGKSTSGRQQSAAAAKKQKKDGTGSGRRNA